MTIAGLKSLSSFVWHILGLKKKNKYKIIEQVSEFRYIGYLSVSDHKSGM